MRRKENYLHPTDFFFSLSLPFLPSFLPSQFAYHKLNPVECNKAFPSHRSDGLLRDSATPIGRVRALRNEFFVNFASLSNLFLYFEMPVGASKVTQQAIECCFFLKIYIEGKMRVRQ